MAILFPLMSLPFIQIEFYITFWLRRIFFYCPREEVLSRRGQTIAIIHSFNCLAPPKSLWASKNCSGWICLIVPWRMIFNAKVWIKMSRKQLNRSFFVVPFGVFNLWIIFALSLEYNWLFSSAETKIRSVFTLPKGFSIQNSALLSP